MRMMGATKGIRQHGRKIIRGSDLIESQVACTYTLWSVMSAVLLFASSFASGSNRWLDDKL
jgi:hypothetical protein